LVRFFGIMMGLLCLLMVWDLCDGRHQRVEGGIALFSMFAATPLVERARSGGVELWILAMLLVLSKLLADERGGAVNTVLVLLVAMLLIATHPYAGSALLVCLLVPMVTQRSKEGGESLTRLRFGWFEARHLAGAVGGLALFSVLWPGFGTGAKLWRRLVGLFLKPHPPVRFGGDVWLQGFDIGAPPFYSTVGLLLMSTSVTAVVLIFLGVFKSRGRYATTLNPLILLALSWLLINSLQGSPYADGYDHRLILLGLFIPFTGRGYDSVESICTRLVAPRYSAFWVAILAVVFGFSVNISDVIQGRAPASGFASDPGAVVRLGGPAFGRAVFEPDLLDVIDTLPANTKLACSPWEEACRKEIVPGIASLGFGRGRLRGGRLFNSDVVVIPNDPTYVSPPALLADFSGEQFSISELFQGPWLRYYVSRVRPAGMGEPTSAPGR